MGICETEVIQNPDNKLTTKFRQHFIIITLIISLFTSIIVNIWQSNQILQFVFTNDSSEFALRRVKRDASGVESVEYSVDTPPPLSTYAVEQNAVNDQHFFVPLFTQLSNSQIDRICREKYATISKSKVSPTQEKVKSSSDHFSQTTRNVSENDNVDETLDENRTTKLRDSKRKSSHHRKHSHSHYQSQRSKTHLQFADHVRAEKVCLPIQEIGAPRVVGERMHHSGAVMRRGRQFLLTEFRTGNTLFQFDADEIDGKNRIKPLSTNENVKLRENEEKSARHYSTEDAEFGKENGIQYEFKKLKGRRRSTVASMAESALKFPTVIHTISESFYGTDHTVGGSENELVFYYIISGTTRLQALHLNSGRRVTRLLNATNEFLYQQPANTSHVSASGEFSSIDLEMDENALWALFRAPNDNALTAVKMAPNSLKELARYHLTQIFSHQVLNAFISCGVLHTVELIDADATASSRDALKAVSYDNWRRLRREEPNYGNNNRTVVVKAVFDFHMERYLTRTLKSANWRSFGAISNIQYDSLSDSLSVFDNGKIITIPLQRSLSK